MIEPSTELAAAGSKIKPLELFFSPVGVSFAVLKY
jgi:hypothetical protein